MIISSVISSDWQLLSPLLQRNGMSMVFFVAILFKSCNKYLSCLRNEELTIDNGEEFGRFLPILAFITNYLIHIK